MKHPYNKFFALAAILTLTVACEKGQGPREIPIPVGEQRVNLVFENTATHGRAFGVGGAEAWEKSVSSATIFVFKSSGACVLRRSLTPAEVVASPSTPIELVFPDVAINDVCDFIAVLNRDLPAAIPTKDALLALIEEDIASYNGTYADVSSKALRTGGFVMTGSDRVVIQSIPSNVTIRVKRVVAKMEVQCTMTDAFREKYQNACVNVESVKISNGAEKTYLIDQTWSKYLTVDSSASSEQTSYCDKKGASATNTYKFNNIFYINEREAKVVGERMKMFIYATYDGDGNLTTTGDQFSMVYEAELKGDDGGTISRNGSYRVNAKLDGIMGQQVEVQIVVLDWDVVSGGGAI